MLERRFTISLNLNHALLVLLIALAHLTTLSVLRLSQDTDLVGKIEELRKMQELQKMAIKIEPMEFPNIRKIGEKNGKGLNQVLTKRGVRDGRETTKPRPTSAPASRRNTGHPDHNPFKALARMNKPTARDAKIAKKIAQARPAGVPITREATSPNPYRLATRPTALEQLTAKSEPVQEVASRTQHGGAAQLAGSPTLSKSLMNMQVEVPEGVAADELNEFELQFYGFQKRLVSKYLNSIELQVREYEKRFSLQALSVPGRHTMTGRVTFDSEGNIKQIKMVRWTQADKLQSLFEDILKSMITLPNAPQMLRNKQGEFVVFYTLTVNNG